MNGDSVEPKTDEHVQCKDVSSPFSVHMCVLCGARATHVDKRQQVKCRAQECHTSTGRRPLTPCSALSRGGQREIRKIIQFTQIQIQTTVISLNVLCSGVEDRGCFLRFKNVNISGLYFTEQK